MHTRCDGFRNDSIATRNTPIEEDLSRRSTGIVRRHFFHNGIVEKV